MEIEKIETRERKSTLSLIALTLLAIILLILSFRIVFEILAGGEIKTVGTMIGIAIVVLAMALWTLKKGFIADEVVTATEEKHGGANSTEFDVEMVSSGRRTFVKGILGAAMAVFIASPIVVVIKFLWPLKTEVSGEAVMVANAIEIPLNSVKERWTFRGFPAIVIHNEDGFESFALRCTHLGCTAQWREQYPGYEGPVIFCPCHDGVFDSKTGEVLSGPPPFPLPEIKVEERGGVIYAIDWKDPAYVARLDVYKV